MPRPTFRNIVVPLLVVGTLVTPTVGVSPVVAQDDDEEVVFRVTLEGPVSPTHTFAVHRECTGPSCVIDSATVLCSPPDEVYDYEPCTETNHEFTLMIEAGRTIEYHLIRWTTADLSSEAAEEYLHASWTVRDGRQVISLGYVYPSPANDVAGGGLLPDTAMTAPSDTE